MDNNNREVSNVSLATSLTILTLNDTPSSSNSRETCTSVSTLEESQSDMDNKPAEMKKKQLIRDLPAHNVPEKIILCLDTCADPECTPFKTGDESAYTSIFMLKRVIEFFVHNKHAMDPRHEFALLALDRANLKWVQEFTNLPREIIRKLNDINFTCDQDEEYDLSVLLDAVWQMVSVPKQYKDLRNPPPYVVRLILLYSRSFCEPVLKKSFKELLENPYFIIDVIASHEEAIEKNKLRDMLNKLQIDEKGYSYNFSVGRDAKLLHAAMAKLLGHPLQRPIQSEILSYEAPVFEKED